MRATAHVAFIAAILAAFGWNTAWASSACATRGGGRLLLEAAPAEKLLKPAGELLGRSGGRAGLREVTGTAADARDLLRELVGARGGAERLAESSYPGILVRLRGGGTVGFREVATASGSAIVNATLDVNIPGLFTGKIKYVP
jgi:hypothetical protein